MKASHRCTLALMMALLLSGGTLERSTETARRISGRITNFATKGPLTGARVRVVGIGHATTDSRGRFKIDASRLKAGVYKVAIRALGHWRRDTWLQVPEAALPKRIRTSWSLIPRSGPMSMTFIDKILRDERGTARWAVVPRFRVIEQRLECEEDVVGPACSSWRASSSPISGSLRATFETAVLTAVPGITGGFAKSVVVESLPLQPGQSMSRQALVRPGYFTLAEQTADTARFLFPEPSGGEAIASQVLLNSAARTHRPWQIVRLIATGLGYVGNYTSEDCDSLEAESVETIHCESHGIASPTESDRIHGAFLYSRPAGNSRPDRDPEPTGARRHRLPMGE